MHLVDANVLLYAYNEGGVFHDKARRWLEERFSSPEIVALSWTVILAFLRIATDRRIFERPLTRAEATDEVESWFALPQLEVLAPGPRHWSILAGLIDAGQAGGKLVMDAHLAALAIEHGATLVSCDRDFARFGGLRWRHPFEQPQWLHDSGGRSAAAPD